MEKNKKPEQEPIPEPTPRGKPGPKLGSTKQKKYSKKDIETALVLNHGMVYKAAESLGCNVKTIYRAVEKSVYLTVLLKDLREREVDEAESKLHTAIKNGEPWAIKLKLMTMGKDRGYTERHEVTGKGGEALNGPVTITGVNYRTAIAPLAPGSVGDSESPSEN